MIIKILNLPSMADDRGVLSVLEAALPFAIERVFWITQAQGQTRGGHGHKKCRQAVVAIGGQVDIFIDNGQEQKTVKLDSANKCLLIEPEYWHTMTFHENASLMVFASHKYDADDYIHEPPQKAQNG